MLEFIAQLIRCQFNIFCFAGGIILSDFTMKTYWLLTKRSKMLN